jgi:hypothetical protein
MATTTWLVPLSCWRGHRGAPGTVALCAEGTAPRARFSPRASARLRAADAPAADDTRASCPAPARRLPAATSRRVGRPSPSRQCAAVARAAAHVALAAMRAITHVEGKAIRSSRRPRQRAASWLRTRGAGAWCAGADGAGAAQLHGNRSRVADPASRRKGRRTCPRPTPLQRPKPRSTDEFRRLGRSTRTYAIEPPTGGPP